MSARSCSQAGRLALMRRSELSTSQRAHVEGCAACTRELEALEDLVLTAREVDAEPMDEPRSEALRARLLDAARRSASPRPSRAPMIVAAVAVAAALLMAVFAGVDHGSSEHTPGSTVAVSVPSTVATASAHETHGTVRASAGAHFTLLSDSPDEIVRLVEGAITVSVTPLGEGERFRVVVGDAEVEVRGTAFEIAASDDRLTSVEVLHGLVEVRVDGETSVLLHAGERWVRASATEATAEIESARAIDEALTSPRDHARARTTTSAPSDEAEVAPAWTAAAGFESGWSALHAGDPIGAARAFGEVVDRAPSDPLAEDASFWRGVALSRADRDADARAALASFVTRYPRSVRAGEAAVMLGWLLRQAGDEEGARAMFVRGASDPAERIRASAARGLASIDASETP